MLTLSVIDTFWTAYNIQFEKSFLQCPPWNVKASPWKDIMIGVKEFLVDPPVSSGIVSLEEAFYLLGRIEYKQEHSALSDVYMEIEVLQHLVNESAYEFPSVADFRTRFRK